MGLLLQVSGLRFVLAALAVGFGLGWYFTKPKKTSLLVAGSLSGVGAIAAQNQVFWVTALAVLAIPWALFAATKLIDLAWRVKVGFVLFLALGSALCIYPTWHDERHGRQVDASLTKEEVVADEEAAKRGERGYARWIRSNIPFRLVRGLDLKGGKRFVYSVEVDEAIKDKRDRAYDDIRSALAQKFGLHSGDQPPTQEVLKQLSAKVKADKPRDAANTITLSFVDAADSAKLDDSIRDRFVRELQIVPATDGKTFTFRIRSDVESDVRNRAVAQAKETVLRRVDGLGLKEAAVSTQGEDIIVEVPGDDDRVFQEIEEIISQTARLEFKMVDDETDFFGTYKQTPEAELPKNVQFSTENAPVGPKRTKPVTFVRIDRLPGEEMRDALGRLRAWTDKLPLDSDHEVGFGKVQGYNKEKDIFEDVGWRTYYLYSRAEITGDMVRDAQATPDQRDRQTLGGWVVSMELTTSGADRFGEITEKNVKRRFAIILDSKVESAPVINERIGGGRAQISMGSQSVDEQYTDAKRLELVLRAGALPAPIAKSNDQRIGPTLGKDAIDQSLKGGAAGAILVLVFMTVYYARAGVIANLAVIFNLILQVAILAMFGASMTLPGIAGLTLTIGIAVDANVLITERIREELRQGKGPRAAVDAGYDKAFSAILDGHVTTLISGLILAQYGSGPIKGFAITLIVGIAVSLFTGVVCTRLLFDWAVRGRKVKALSVG